MQKHKTLGQVYTPKWIVNEILDLADYKGKNILQKYILEPSCGDGAFLCKIVKRYIEVAKENNISENKIIKDLETYIYGVELDTQEFEGYYEYSTEPWDFEDVDNQREIGSEIIMIINPVINKKDA